MLSSIGEAKNPKQKQNKKGKIRIGGGMQTCWPPEARVFPQHRHASPAMNRIKEADSVTTYNCTVLEEGKR